MCRVPLTKWDIDIDFDARRNWKHLVPHGALDYSPPCLVNLNPRFFSAFPFFFSLSTISKHILSRALVITFGWEELLSRTRMSSFLECKKNKVFHDKTYKYIIRRRRRRKFSISSNIRRIKYISQYIIRRRRKFSRIYKNRDEEFNIELDPFPDSFDLAESHDSLSLSLVVFERVCTGTSSPIPPPSLSLSFSQGGWGDSRGNRARRTVTKWL